MSDDQPEEQAGKRLRRTLDETFSGREDPPTAQLAAELLATQILLQEALMHLTRIAVGNAKGEPNLQEFEALAEKLGEMNSRIAASVTALFQRESKGHGKR